VAGVISRLRSSMSRERGSRAEKDGSNNVRCPDQGPSGALRRDRGRFRNRSHALAIEALNASIATSATPAEVATDLTVLALYAGGLLAVATVLLRRTITQRAM
jgi:hypothetical protein